MGLRLITEAKLTTHKLTAGEDQLPQDSANVTNGSDNSNPNLLLTVFSSFFAPFENVWWD